MISISTSYPLTRRRKDELTQLGAKISPGDVAIVDLTSSPLATKSFLDELASFGERVIDPIVQPTFGTYGSVMPQIQQEVFNIIGTYETLTAADFENNNIPSILPAAVPLPAAQMWQFHHAQMALVGVVMRLADPGIGPLTNTIHRIPAASFICDLSIMYANVVFVLRIMRTAV